jgi:hypothetical protein
MTGAVAPVNAIERAAPVPLGTSSLPCPQQLELMRGADGSLPAGAIHAVRGRGRPKGALNKRSKRIADYYVQRYGDPLDAIGQLANTPLRQLIEVLLEADGSAEREAKVLEGVDQAVAAIKELRRLPEANHADVAGRLADAIERLASAAAATTGKAGKLALDALALQTQAQFKAAEYVHGKQPIAIDLRKQADVVLVAPELLKEHGIDPTKLADAIAQRGLEALDSLTMVDGEFTDSEE